MRRFADVSWVNVLGVAAALCALAACGSKASCPKGTVDQGGRCVETNSDASAEDADTGGDGGDACVGAACQPVCAAEVCNGKDDDCDTFVDEGVQTFGPTQEMPNMAAFLVGIAPWAQEKTIAFVLPTNASPASLQLVELSKDGVPAGAGRTVFNSLSASFVGDVVGDVVLAFAQPLNGDPMRLLTYDLIAKKTIKGRTLEGKLLSYSVVDEGGEQLLRVASRVATNNPKVTTYSFPELVFKAERSFSTNPGDTLPQLLTGAGDETLYTVIEDTLLGLTDGGAVLSYTLPGANLVFGAQIAVTPDRVAVLHADQASGNGRVAFSVFSKELELLSEVILQTADGLNALGVGGSVVAGADGTWYVAYDADINASPITAAHATRVARYRENGAELQELFAELLPCELGTCPEPSTALVIPSLALDGATGLVGTVHGSQFVGHLTPFGCY